MTNDATTVELVARELGVDGARVRAVARLLDDGATIPFIARYRKEQTGELDETVLRDIQAAIDRQQVLKARRGSMIASLEERDMLTGDLRSALVDATSLTELEDIYLPFRPKRVTRASKARERGLKPLATLMLDERDSDPFDAAAGFLAPELGVQTVDDALQGARDIVAERVAEDRESRRELRDLFERRGVLRSSRSRKAADSSESDLFRDYFSWSEPASRAPSHRVLAILRGERQGVLVVHLEPPEDQALGVLRRRWGRRTGPGAGQMELAVEDSYKRLLLPSLESERKSALFATAGEAAAQVFAANLRDLLLAAPLGPRRLLAVDPGFRTGCKVVCLDEHGSLLHHEAIYPLEPHRKEAKSAGRIAQMVDEYRLEVIAVGNGTGGREAVAFLRGISPQTPPVMPVSEAGASVYSASEIARAEFPDCDVTVRGAVSIGRRLMDPLAELVKIDPRSIGVGQYQHDIDVKLLESRLQETVESCVNLVGADLNTASPHLLRHISGVSERVAKAIVDYRDQAGGFARRLELKKVPGIGPRIYEQAAGFLRVRGGIEPLDATAVHPERYQLVERMAADMGVSKDGLVGDPELAAAIDLSRYESEEVGMPTLRDIVAELRRPGHDPRPDFTSVSFREDVHTIADLAVGMALSGVVTNVTDFGAFVDVGVHRDGLVHVSKLSREFVRNPRDVVRAGQVVEVTVTEIDVERKRISLSMVSMDASS